MTSNQLHRRYLTLQKAVENELGSAGSKEKYIVILPPTQGDAYATDVEGCNYFAFAAFYEYEDKLLKIDSFAPQSEMEPSGFS